MVAMLEKIHFPGRNVMLIGNREGRHSVDPKNAERAVGLAFAAVLPEDDRVTVAANQGIPAITTVPGVPFTVKIRALAKTVAGRIGRTDRVTA